MTVSTHCKKPQLPTFKTSEANFFWLPVMTDGFNRGNERKSGCFRLRAEKVMRAIKDKAWGKSGKQLKLSFIWGKKAESDRYLTIR